jgi:hypothetical protein
MMVGTFDTDPPVQMLQHYPNVDNVPEDTYELDESTNVFNVNPGKEGFPIIFFLVSWGGARLSPLGTSATIRPTAPAPDDR